jgi:putative ABC transport system permease protein
LPGPANVISLARRIASDARLALRSLRREWKFTSIAVLTLALGIGPNAAIFSAVHTLLVAPLPFPEAHRLVRLEAERGGEPAQLSYREIRDLREELDRIFEGVAGYTDQGQYNASGDGRPEELVSTITTHDLFSVLRVPLLMGEPWPEILDRTRDFKVVISHGLWQRRFGGARDILGRSMVLDGAPGYTVVGVLPAGFEFPIRSDLYRSHGIASDPVSYENRANRGRWGLARLRDGVTIEQAEGALRQLAARLENQYPASNAGISYRVTPLRDQYVGNARSYLVLVMAAVGLVLLFSCRLVS